MIEQDNKHSCTYVKDYFSKEDANDLSILNTEAYRQEFPNMELEDILHSQHLIILNLKKRVAELEHDLYHHNTSLNQNY